MVCPLKFSIDFTERRKISLKEPGSGQTKGFTWEHLPIDFDFIRFHSFLNRRTQLPQSYIDPCFLILELANKTKAEWGTRPTRTPVSVAALTASTSFSYVGSHISVNAESRILPLTCTPMSTFHTSPCCSTSGLN